MKSKSYFLVLVLFIVCGYSFTQAQYKEFSFAWITDTHIGYLPASKDLKNIIDEINRRDDISFLILSGDVTEKGKTKELIEAKSLLDKLKVRYFVIPGNHDYKWSESGCAEFFTQFNDDKFAFKFNEFLFLGLNSANPMRGGMGHFASHDLKWLDTFLNSLKNETSPIIFFTHFPVDRNNIDNYYPALKLLSKKNIQFIGVGHGHENKRMDFDGIDGVMARSTLARNQNSGYMLVKVQKDSIVFQEKQTGSDSIGWRSSMPIKQHPVDSLANSNPNEWKYFDNKKFVSLWTDSLNYSVVASPVKYEDKGLFCDMLGRINCYDISDGKKIWEYQLDNSILSTPAIHHGNALIISVDGRMYYFDIKSGKIKWQSKFGFPILGNPVIEGDTAYVGTSEYSFIAVGLNSGSELWSFKDVSGHVESTPLVCDNKIFFTAWDGFLYALDRNDGKLLWKWSEEKPNFYYAPAACSPVVMSGKIAITAPNKFVTLLDAAIGNTIFRNNLHPSWESISSSPDRKQLYVKGLTDTLFCYIHEADSLKLIWFNVLGYGFETSPLPVTEKSGNVYIPAGNGFLYCVDAKTGKFKWEYFLGESILNNPVILDDGSIILSNMDGVIRRIRYK